MPDPRIRKLAEILVNYSTKVKPGDWVHIEGHVLTEPLMSEVVACVLEAGGHPTVNLESESYQENIYTKASEEQLKWMSPIERLVVNEIDVNIYLEASQNTRFLSSIDPSRQQIRRVAGRELFEKHMQRAAEGSLRWVLTQYPCPAFAQEADMSQREFEDFVYHATFADQDNPVAHWQKIHDEQQCMVDWLKGKVQVSVKSPNADLTLSVEDRPFMNADGSENMPSGEIYTSPIEDSANGWVYFTYPAIMSGREVEGVRLEFKDGKVVKESAKKNEEFLTKMLDSDEGARYLGEFAIGTNYGIDRFTKSILYDEKIGGSFHLAVGAGFPECLGENKSSIHWDLICDIREDSEIRVDGELFYKDGQFQV
jgi:aminopeptidase